MSHRLEYQWAAFHIAGAPLGLSEDRFIVAIEGGDNNLYEGRTGRRARSWDACMVGTRVQVLRQAVYFAGACEGGSLKPHGRDCTPENYIRRIRRLLDGEGATPSRGTWQARLRVTMPHPVVEDLRCLGLDPSLERRYDTTRAVLDIPPERLAAYFGLIDRYIDELPAWCWMEVGGLPAS